MYHILQVTAGKTRTLLICPSQLLATGSKRRICLPDVFPSSCSKFLSLPRPSHLSLFSVFPSLHAMFAAGLASEPLREITLKFDGVALSGKDGERLCSGNLLTYVDSRLDVTHVPVHIFYQHNAKAKHLNTLRASTTLLTTAQFSSIKIHLLPIHLSLAQVFPKVGWAECFVSAVASSSSELHPRNVSCWYWGIQCCYMCTDTSETTELQPDTQPSALCAVITIRHR